MIAYAREKAMIPLKLCVKNFLSYGSQPQIIHFEAYHLICLSGKNGHGKSALLDALTWVLWGWGRQAPGTCKTDGHLHRVGGSEMVVGLDFFRNGVTFRVRRGLTIPKNKRVARLGFGVVEPGEEGRFRSLTEKTIRETQ